MGRARIRIDAINALAELERIGWKYKPAGDDEVMCKCPCHDDNTPSVSLNVKKNVWTCQAASCGAKGDIVTFLAHCLKTERAAIILDIAERYDVEVVKSVKPDLIEKYHEQIWKAGPLLQALKDRGITDTMIRKARLGYHEGRIMIPVYDDKQRAINIRKYLPGAPGNEKMKNLSGYTSSALYQAEQTKFQQVWLCGGEMKALVVGALLNKHGVGAVAPTMGEGGWDEKFNKSFKDKHVYICYDVDAAGKRGAKKVARHLMYMAASIRIIDLPLDLEKYPKGDVNDYVGQEGATAKDLLKLMESAEKFVPEDVEAEAPAGEAVKIRLLDATKPEYVGKRVTVDAVVTAMDTTPYLVPKDVAVSCSRDQPFCGFCSIRPKPSDKDSGETSCCVSSKSKGLLSLIDVSKSMMQKSLADALGIPACKVAEFRIKSYHSVNDIRIVPKMEISGQNSDYIVQQAFVVGHQLDLNVPYLLTGSLWPEPKTQQATLVLDAVQQSADSLTYFTPTPEDLKSLEVFSPKVWSTEGIDEVLNRLYTDLEANVTRIYYRRELHLMVDLAYHSVLYLNFDAQTQKGWVNVLITGDSSQGKSEASTRLMEHYGLGERVECKNASVAGLLGGLQQMGTKWFVAWGVIPTHDRRLVIMEEIKGASTEVLSKLTDMRSSGIAELPKIEKRRSHARTRLIMISNPRSNRQMSAFSFGVEALQELIGSPEDIRRFDAAIIMSAQQINAEEINKLSTSRPHHEHMFTKELCRRLILWAWTRDEKQVVFEKEAVDLCLKSATELCNRFTEALPLVDRGTMRLKLARLAAALAVRTFSHTTDVNTVLVRACHVQYISDKLNCLYSDEVFGYLTFTKAKEFTGSILDPEQVKRTIEGTKFPRDFVDHLIHADEVSPSDICDWIDVDRDTGRVLLSLFVRKHALYREKTWYRKTTGFIELLKTMKSNGVRNTGVPVSKEDKF
jgi:hypothetical protein